MREVIVVAPTFFIPPIPIPGVVAIPLVDVDAPAVELVYLRDTAMRRDQAVGSRGAHPSVTARLRRDPFRAAVSWTRGSPAS